MKEAKNNTDISEIISIEAKNGIETVNARDLHSYLESKQDFSTWIKSRIEKYSFIEDSDYTLIHKKMEQVSGAKYSIEYHVSIDMAKQLSMVENNIKGNEARRYFIRCEKSLKNIQENINQIVSAEVKKYFDELKIFKTVKPAKQIERKEKVVIVKKYNLYGRVITLVRYKKVNYQICPNYYIPSKFDLRYDDREVGSEIKKGFFSFDQVIKFLERNL